MTSAPRPSSVTDSNGNEVDSCSIEVVSESGAGDLGRSCPSSWTMPLREMAPASRKPTAKSSRRSSPIQSDSPAMRQVARRRTGQTTATLSKLPKTTRSRPQARQSPHPGVIFGALPERIAGCRSRSGVRRRWNVCHHPGHRWRYPAIALWRDCGRSERMSGRSDDGHDQAGR